MKKKTFGVLIIGVIIGICITLNLVPLYRVTSDYACTPTEKGNITVVSKLEIKEWRLFTGWIKRVDYGQRKTTIDKDLKITGTLGDKVSFGH